ncbi:MAG TPA: sugar transferase [Planctomycetes bacterium]|nr:sugar transferase [Planctomycetota bacterium]
MTFFCERIIETVTGGWDSGEGSWVALHELPPIFTRLPGRRRARGGAVEIRFGNARRTRADALAVRVLEVILAATVLLVGAPLWAFIALLVSLDGASPLFVQERVGENGALFRFLKFRTMKPCTTDAAHRQFVQAIAAGKPMTAMPNADRVTWIGRFLRKSGLDEIPQFIHVLSGRMAVVGPRPPLPYEVELYHECHKARLNARPGITGLWQVYGKSEGAFEEQTLVDVFYISNRSLVLDLTVMLKTAWTVLSCRGGH